MLIHFLFHFSLTRSNPAILRAPLFLFSHTTPLLPSNRHRTHPPCPSRQQQALAATMNYNRPSYRLPRIAPERQYPAGVIVENQLRVWAISRWRGARELAEFFLVQGYRHLSRPRGSPPMFFLQGYFDGNHEIGLTVRFTNPHEDRKSVV